MNRTSNVNISPKVLLQAAAALLLSTALTGCVQPPPLAAPPPPPTPLVMPALSAQDISAANQKSYNDGFAAGRRYQLKQDEANSSQTGQPHSTEDGRPATAAQPAAVAVPPTPALPVSSTPPANAYYSKGPAQPVAAPGN